jgi:hypothetical protein
MNSGHGGVLTKDNISTEQKLSKNGTGAHPGVGRFGLRCSPQDVTLRPLSPLGYHGPCGIHAWSVARDPCGRGCFSVYCRDIRPAITGEVAPTCGAAPLATHVSRAYKTAYN